MRAEAATGLPAPSWLGPLWGTRTAAKTAGIEASGSATDVLAVDGSAQASTGGVRRRGHTWWQRAVCGAAAVLGSLIGSAPAVAQEAEMPADVRQKYEAEVKAQRQSHGRPLGVVSLRLNAGSTTIGTGGAIFGPELRFTPLRDVHHALALSLRYFGMPWQEQTDPSELTSKPFRHAGGGSLEYAYVTSEIFSVFAGANLLVTEKGDVFAGPRLGFGLIFEAESLAFMGVRSIEGGAWMAVMGGTAYDNSRGPDWTAGLTIAVPFFGTAVIPSWQEAKAPRCVRVPATATDGAYTHCAAR